jgi:hypothetical protein
LRLPELYNRRYRPNAPVDFSYVHTQDPAKCHWGAYNKDGLPDENEAWRRIAEIRETDEFQEISPVRGAEKDLARLAAVGCKTFFVTNRQESIIEPTKRMLDRHFAGLYEEALFTSRFFDGTTYREARKSEICLSRGIRVVAEDFPDNVTDLANADISVAVVDNPWNHGMRLLPNMRRVRDFGEAVTAILATGGNFDGRS